jgi:hypothetical protein
LVSSVSTPSNWGDDQVDAEYPGHTGECRRQPRDRMASDALKCRRPQRDQNQITGIGCHRRQHTHRHDDEGKGFGGRHQHDLADQRTDQSGLFRQANADHGNKDHPDGSKAEKVPDGGGDDEADAIGGEQAVDAGRLLVCLVRRRIDHLVGDADPEQMEQMGQHDDDACHRQEDDGGMRDFVAGTLDRIQQLLQERLFRRRLAHCRLSDWSAR